MMGHVDDGFSPEMVGSDDLGLLLAGGQDNQVHPERTDDAARRPWAGVNLAGAEPSPRSVSDADLPKWIMAQTPGESLSALFGGSNARTPLEVKLRAISRVTAGLPVWRKVIAALETLSKITPAAASRFLWWYWASRLIIESHLQNEARSSTGAVGIGQVVPKTAFGLLSGSTLSNAEEGFIRASYPNIIAQKGKRTPSTAWASVVSELMLSLAALHESLQAVKRIGADIPLLAGLVEARWGTLKPLFAANYYYHNGTSKVPYFYRLDGAWTKRATEHAALLRSEAILLNSLLNRWGAGGSGYPDDALRAESLRKARALKIADLA